MYTSPILTEGWYNDTDLDMSSSNYLPCDVNLWYQWYSYLYWYLGYMYIVLCEPANIILCLKLITILLHICIESFLSYVIDFYGYIKSICLLLIYSAHKLSALDTSYRSGNLPYMALSRFTITQILYIGQWQSTVRQMQLLTLILYNITNFYKYKYGTNTSQFMEIRKNTFRTSW